MKYENRIVRLWEAGDYVYTPDGAAVVEYVEEDTTAVGDYTGQDLIVQYVNPGLLIAPRREWVDGSVVTSISKEEYDEEVQRYREEV